MLILVKLSKFIRCNLKTTSNITQRAIISVEWQYEKLYKKWWLTDLGKRPTAAQIMNILQAIKNLEFQYNWFYWDYTIKTIVSIDRTKY